MVHFERWKVILVLAVTAIGIALIIPNFFPRQTVESWPSYFPRKQLSLGLDLQGGSHLLLEVDVESVVRERMSTLVGEVRDKLRPLRINYQGLEARGPVVVFSVLNAEEVEKARDAVRGIDRDTQIEVEGSRISMRLTEQAIRDRRSKVVEQSIEIVRRRIDEVGVREPTIVRQGNDRILVQLPGERDPEGVKRILNKTAKMNFHLLDETTSVEQAQQGRVPPGSMLLEGDDDTNRTGQRSKYLVQRRIRVDGGNLTDAQPTFQDGRPVVSFRFNSVGARHFADVTRQNVGHPFAIVLDNKVISAPVIREPILGGSGIISGNFSVQTARDLAILLRAGALPASLKVIEERTVGAELGADSIRAGQIASILAAVLVVVFMFAAYGLFGLFANLALILNVVLIGAAMSLIQATLTLPGIAGIALTIGMAVDANVLIYERMREEQRLGRTPIAAIDTGFRRALTAIIDSNLTTFISALMLYQFGTGPVKGFAVTLSLGLATTVFTATLVTRLMVITWLRQSRPKLLPI